MKCVVSNVFEVVNLLDATHHEFLHLIVVLKNVLFQLVLQVWELNQDLFVLVLG